MTFIDEVFDAIKESNELGCKKKLEGVSGFSGDKLIGLLQRCAYAAQGKGKSYLEIGVYQGLSLSSVASSAPSIKCFGIDNFSQFDVDGINQSIVLDRLKKHAHGNATLINLDFEEALLNISKYIGEDEVAVYFIDGPHDYRSQYLCLDFIVQSLSRDCVIIIDDSNYEHVRRANADWLKANPDFALIFESYTKCHPNNMDIVDKEEAEKGWWNGVNVIVKDLDGCLNRIYPSVSEDRRKYFDQHIGFSERNAELSNFLLAFSRSGLLRKIVALFKLKFLAKNYKDRFDTLNTYSQELPARLATKKS